MKVYVYEVEVREKGVKGVLNDSFTIEEIVYNAENEVEAIQKLDQQLDNIGYKALRGHLKEILTHKEYKNKYIK